MEGMGTALSHTSGISLWRGWAPHYPTHWASARGGDGHHIIPHIGHQPEDGMGTLSFLQAGRSCGTGLRDLHRPDVVYWYQQLPVFLGAGAPALERTLLSRVACGGKDTASPHTSGTRLWRRWAALYPTHRASARGGDAHCSIPHIGHPLMEGMGTVSFHTSGRHCPDPDGSCVMAGWPPKGPHRMITRGSCSVYTHQLFSW